MVGLQQKAPVLHVRQKCTELEKANPSKGFTKLVKALHGYKSAKFHTLTGLYKLVQHSN